MIDPAEFEQFMRAYQNMVFTVAMRLLGREVDALDIAQETFVKAYEHFGDLHNNPAAGGWLKRVCTNLALNHLSRYRARWRFFSELFTQENPEAVDALIQSEDASGEADEVAHRRFYLEHALRQLPAAQRVPLVLYHFEELSYEEIAARLKISLSKVKTDIHRGRLTLRRFLDPGAARGHLNKDESKETESGSSFWGDRLIVAVGRL